MKAWGAKLRRLFGRRTSAGRRRHIREGASVDDFFAELKRRNVRYAVLRWFEDLPRVAEGEDIDLLVHDDDLPLIDDLFGGGAGAPCDVYSVSGKKAGNRQGTPYLPAGAAANLLDRSILLRERYRIPNPEDHFLSMAYHALYHKGFKSGLPTRFASPESVSQPEHDYAEVLRNLASGLGLTVSIDMESLDDRLASRGWLPTAETIGRLAERNAWVAARHRSAR